MNLVVEAKTILERNEYRIMSVKDDNISFLFEDESILGFAAVFTSIGDLIKNWKKIQTSFIIKFSEQFAQEPIKAWNAYSLFFTGDRQQIADKALIKAIEEDLEGTRKIIGHSLSTISDIERAIAPLLPIKQKVHLPLESYVERLKDRIDTAELFLKMPAEELYELMEKKK